MIYIIQYHKHLLIQGHFRHPATDAFFIYLHSYYIYLNIIVHLVFKYNNTYHMLSQCFLVQGHFEHPAPDVSFVYLYSYYIYPNVIVNIVKLVFPVIWAGFIKWLSTWVSYNTAPQDIMEHPHLVRLLARLLDHLLITLQTDKFLNPPNPALTSLPVMIHHELYMELLFSWLIHDNISSKLLSQLRFTTMMSPCSTMTSLLHLYF